jgi:predicted metal-dependent HD superfamily phosphohydrolase
VHVDLSPASAPAVVILATIERWQTACKTCGCAGAAEDYCLVIRGWSSWGRRYHTRGHLEACLGEFDQARDLALNASEVELALWLHDVVYRTWRSDNEARSATLAVEIMSHGGASSAAVHRVVTSILATRHQGREPNGDAALVADIDLSILGQPEETYLEFEQNVRREYWWMPRRRYVAARCAKLESFLKRTSIYRYPEFQRRYETAARVNLALAITRLNEKAAEPHPTPRKTIK